MKKNELLKLIETLKDEDSVLDILSQNLTKENYGELSKVGDGQSFFDNKVTSAVETFKTNTMPKLIEAEVLKRTEKQETPLEKEVRELREKVEKSEKEKTKAEMIAKFKDTLNEKGIPTKLIDFVLGEDEDVTNANITLFEECMKGYTQKQVDERFKEHSHNPTNNNNNPSNTEGLSPLQLMSQGFNKEK